MQVEIIGDAYFAVGGCPDRCEDHAERCAAAAAEMLEYMPKLRQQTGECQVVCIEDETPKLAGC